MNKELTISRNGLELIKKFEGLHELKNGKVHSYLCPANVWTIGWGSTRYNFKPVHEGLVLSIQECEELLNKDIKYFEAAIKLHVKVPLTQNQFDALCSFVFNIGPTAFSRSTLLRLINAKQFDKCPEQFKKWKFAAGSELKGLIARREAEARLFSTE